MGGRLRNICFLAAFMLMITVPPLFSDKSGGGVSEEENRMLAKRPNLSYLLNYPEEYPGAFERWIADNIKFRGGLIKAYGAIDRIETRGQYWKGDNLYLIGEEGHHFFAYSGGGMIDKYRGKPIISDSLLQATADSLGRIKAYLDERGIPLVIMFAADKETIYPEYYPKSIIRGPEPIPLDIVTDYLRENTGAETFNIREALTAEKGDYLLYYKDKGDLAHYNVIGGFFAYRELMRHIQAFLPDVRIMSEDEVDFTFDGDGIPAITLKEGPKYEALGDEFFDGVGMVRPFLRGTAATQNEDPGLPALLMMRDSYFTLDLMPALPQSFSQAILIDYLGNMANLRQYVEAYNPDIVVIAVAEREIGVFAGDLKDSGAW